ncbi:MAG: gliding motility-associated C-terminal domain-containing protein, partial [Bacteroidetes bacterium]|nr:gliding motility-associated C-terminal domain-containing protein [Bacteroidota bacterium]
GTWSPAIDNTATTTYTFTPTAGQCATTTTLTITVNPNVTPTFAAVAPICSGDALAALPTTSINGITGTWSPAIDNTATTTYTFTPTVGQCATTTTLTITVNPVFSSTENFQICAGSNYTYPDGTTSVNIVADETHISVLAAINSCDSLVTTTITVVNSMTGTESAAICSGSDYTFPDGTIHTGILSNESYVSTLTSVMGCDSLVTTNIIVNPVYNLVENTLICENTTYFFPDGSSQVITANTSHISNLTTALGCDSSITTNITMTPVYAITENATVCENTNYLFPDGTNQVITASVTHVSSLFTASGCDSVVTTVITMNPVYTVTETVTICDGDNYTFPDGTVHAGITTNENYTSFFSSITGCDSIIITMLEVQPLPNVLAGADQLVCNGASVTLSATGAATYSWSGGVVNGVPFMPTQLSQSFTVTGTDNFGCQNSDDVLVDVNPELSPFFTSDVTAGCAPLTVSFENLTSGGQTCLWNFGDGSYSSDCSGPVYTYTNPGSFDVTLTLTDNAGCTFTNTLFGYITVAGTPDAAFYADRYVVDDLDSEVDFTNNSTGASWYEWYFGDGTGTDFNENPSHIFPTVAENGTYLVTLVAGNSQNCMDTAQALITVNDVIVFYVPNVFTPDGDSFNETFQPVFTSGFDPFDYHLIIFNRWGELIFESFNAAVGWSGTYSDEGLVTDDVYVWKIEFRESMSDKRHDYLGHVTVLK